MRLGCCIVILAAAITSIARADHSDDMRKSFANVKMAEVDALVARGQLRPAIAILEAAYAATNHAPLLFNLGALHQTIGETSGSEKELRIALDYFRRFVEAAPQAAERGEAERAIGELVVALKLSAQPPPVVKTTPPQGAPNTTPPPQEAPKTTPPQEAPKTAPSLEAPKTAPPKPAPRAESMKRRPSPVAACPAPVPPPAPPIPQVASTSPSLALGVESYRDAGFNLHQRRALVRSQLGDHAGAIAEYLAAHDLIPKSEVLCSIAAETIKACNTMAGDEDATIGCFESARDFYQRCYDSGPPATTDNKVAPPHEIRDIDLKVSDLRGQKDRKARFWSRLYFGGGVGAGVIGIVALSSGIALKQYSTELTSQYLNLGPTTSMEEKWNKLNEAQSANAWGAASITIGVLASAGASALFWLSSRNGAKHQHSRRSFAVIPTVSGILVSGIFE